MVEFPWEVISPELLFVGRFLITDSVSLLVMSLFKFCIFFVSVFVIYMFLGICPFLPDWPICWHIIAHNILIIVFFSCGVGCDLSSFICDIIYLGSFLFFWSNWLGVYQFVNSFKEPALGFVDLFCFFFLFFIFLI